MDKSVWQQFLDMRACNAEQIPSFLAELRALGREAMKDINDKMHQTFFGQRDGMGEPGTPLVPTQAMVTKDLGTVHGYGAMLEEAAARAAQPNEKEKER